MKYSVHSSLTMKLGFFQGKHNNSGEGGIYLFLAKRELEDTILLCEYLKLVAKPSCFEPPLKHQSLVIICMHC